MHTLKSSARAFLNQSHRYIKLLCWLLFIIGIIGYWRFQHLLVLDTLSPLGITPTTLICLIIVLVLLPYSLSHRIRFNIHWYSLIFVPTTIILSVIANEHIGIVDLSAAFSLTVVFIWLVIKKPKLNCKPINSNLWLLLLQIIFSLVFTNTSELDHFKHEIRHHLAHKNYYDALMVGKKSDDTDSTIFNLRAEAMIRTNQLGNQLFTFPIPKQNHLVISSPLDAQQARDLVLCNLLLSKQLDSFIATLQKYYDINSASLPLHYKEAIVVFLSQSVSTKLDYSDVVVQENFSEFMAERNKYTNSIKANNMCRSLYGNTYFWYYFYFPLSNNN